VISTAARACRAILAVLVAALAAGCAGVKTYPNTLDKNLQIRSETVSGSALFRLQTSLGVYRLDESCQLEFEGAMDIGQPGVPVGLPPGRWSYLVFTFSGSSFLGGSSTSISRETMILPRAGHRYDVQVSYRNDIYHVTIREIPPKGGAGREVDFRNIRACRPPWRAAATRAAADQKSQSR
jgi:hypothetical protein